MADIIGTAAADTLNGTSAADRISGGNGGDWIGGGGGDDVLYGFGAGDATPGGGAILAQRLSTALLRPVYAVSAPGDPDRLYVSELHTGRIRIVDPATGAIAATPFLDIPDAEVGQGGSEGLLGFAFHPDYAANGVFFVYLTNAAGNNEVRRYQRSAADPDQADPASGDVILTIPHPTFGNHNGGWMDFGLDGYLYIATGDGGSGGDPNNNAQNKNSLLGKMLRIDIDGDGFPGDDARDYVIPANNPFVNEAAAGEIWALGLRHPWRNSFDRLTGDLYIADVGQQLREEVNVQAAASAGAENYGWKVKEGSLVYNDTVPGNPPATSPPLTAPVVEYAHVAAPGGGFSITGGYVYRGASLDLQGAYLFADFVTNQLWSFRLVNGVATEFTNRTTQFIASGGAVDSITSFGEDSAGDLYILGYDGEMFRLAPGAGSGDGADTIQGGLGNDTIYSGAGNDAYLAGDDGADTIYGGFGADRIDGGADGDAWLGGGADADYVTGGAGVDRIDGGDGGDTWLGGGGEADFVTGGAGADRIDGGDGGDTWLGGGAGADYITAGDGNDRADGGSEADSIYGGAGADYITGGDEASGGDTWLGGEAGNDSLWGNGGNDRIDGGADTDGLFGEAGADTMTGGTQNDYLDGGAGIDRLNGGSENDTLIGGSDADVLTGGAGNDSFVYTFASDGGASEQIGDWKDGLDKLRIDASNFGGGLGAGALDANRLVAGAAPVADQAFGQFLYTTSTGVLSWDADGTGAGAALALVKLFSANFTALAPAPAVADFDIVA